MQKLRELIQQHQRWAELVTYLDRIEAHVEADFSLSLENAKALLESIGKQICKDRSVPVEKTATMNAVLKKAFVALGYANDGLVTQVSGALATIAQHMGTLRNEIGTTSHGRHLADLKERNSKVDLFTRELLIDTTEIIGAFLIRGFEADHPFVRPAVVEEEPPQYDSNAAFNEFWDELFGEFEMEEYSYPASEILFSVDPKAYITECEAFRAEGEGELAPYV
jgi:Abortive infection C-terminus